jgi:hypothetical protein
LEDDDMGDAGAGPTAADRFFGLYRGVVTDNLDPEQRGRLAVVCPDVGGEAASWALPCVPMAGPQVGLWAVPPVGAAVWLQFEAGSADRPVWMGSFWTDAASVVAAGDIVLRSPAGASLTIGDSGVTLENGRGASIVMQGPTVVINNGGLEIT